MFTHKNLNTITHRVSDYITHGKNGSPENRSSGQKLGFFEIPEQIRNQYGGYQRIERFLSKFVGNAESN